MRPSLSQKKNPKTKPRSKQKISRGIACFECLSAPRKVFSFAKKPVSRLHLKISFFGNRIIKIEGKVRI
jgi:hypothetical protein